MTARWVGICSLLLLSLLPSWGQNAFRTFKTDTGQPFAGRVLSYEGRTFYVQGRNGRLFAIPFNKVSPEDQKYLIQIAPKLPKGDPRKINAKEGQSPAPSAEKSESSSTSVKNDTVPKPSSPPKPQFRPGSFFAYKPINLGQDPSMEEGAKPSSGGGVADMSKGISFHDHVFPLLEERCLDCHGEPYVKNGRTIHPKAGLRLDTYEWIIKGNLDGTILEKGNPDESTLIAVITLDSDDPEIMPPKGDPLTEDEINMLKQWILEGAKENPSDTFAPPEKEDVVALDSSDKKESIIDKLSKRLNAPSKPQMEAAQKSGALVSLISVRHSMVRAEFSSGPTSIKDDAIGALSAIKNNISHLDLSRTSVTDSVLGEVKKFNNLTWLNLKDTAVSDRGIKNLSKMPYLTYLNLVSSKVTDESIETIAGLRSLEEIYLWNSKVSKRGFETLQNALPNAKIIH